MDKMMNYMPPMITGEALDAALRIAPDYDPKVRKASEAERLIGLQDIYSVYIPTEMSREIYSKPHLL